MIYKSYRLACPAALTIKMDGDGVGNVIEGVASTDILDSQNDIVVPGAFRDAISHVAAGARMPMLWQHDPEQPIGAWNKLVDEAGALVAGGTLTLEVQRAREAKALIEAGAVTGLSIGFRVPPGGAEYDPNTGVRLLKRLILKEISLVTFPANDECRIMGVKADGALVQFDAKQSYSSLSKNLRNPRIAENYLHARGMSKRESRLLVRCLRVKSGVTPDKTSDADADLAAAVAILSNI